MSPDDIQRRAFILALIWGAVASLTLSLAGYLLSQPEPSCARGEHFVYPLERCTGWVVKGAHLP